MDPTHVRRIEPPGRPEGMPVLEQARWVPTFGRSLTDLIELGTDEAPLHPDQAFAWYQARLGEPRYPGTQQFARDGLELLIGARGGGDRATAVIYYRDDQPAPTPDEQAAFVRDLPSGVEAATPDELEFKSAPLVAELRCVDPGQCGDITLAGRLEHGVRFIVPVREEGARDLTEAVFVAGRHPEAGWILLRGGEVHIGFGDLAEKIYRVEVVRLPAWLGRRLYGDRFTPTVAP